jgi:hypothetical protein
MRKRKELLKEKSRISRELRQVNQSLKTIEHLNGLDGEATIDEAVRLMDIIDPCARDIIMGTCAALSEKNMLSPEAAARQITARGVPPTKDVAAFTYLVGSLGNETIGRAYMNRFKPLDPGKQAVRDYLWVCQKLFEGSQEDDAIRGYGVDDMDEGVRLSRLLWTYMRDARVFEVPVDTWKAVVDQGLYEMAERLGIKREQDHHMDDDEYKEMEREFTEFCAERPPEMNLAPFEWIFIAVGSMPFGYRWNDFMMTQRLPPGLEKEDVLRLRLAGYLINDKGSVYEMMVVHHQTEGAFLIPGMECDQGKWTNPWTCNALFIPTLLRAIEDHRTFVEHKPTRGMRYDFKRHRKVTGGSKILPKPYYTIQLDPTQVLHEKQRTDGVSGRELSYRYDRSGHERCYIRRGALPLTDKERKKLEARGYRVYTTQPLSAEDGARLARREKRPKRPTEWVAIKHRRIAATVVGPEHLPYVPAVRVPK